MPEDILLSGKQCSFFIIFRTTKYSNFIFHKEFWARKANFTPYTRLSLLLFHFDWKILERICFYFRKRYALWSHLRSNLRCNKYITIFIKHIKHIHSRKKIYPSKSPGLYGIYKPHERHIVGSYLVVHNNKINSMKRYLENVHWLCHCHRRRRHRHLRRRWCDDLSMDYSQARSNELSLLMTQQKAIDACWI